MWFATHENWTRTWRRPGASQLKVASNLGVATREHVSSTGLYDCHPFPRCAAVTRTSHALRGASIGSGIKCPVMLTSSDDAVIRKSPTLRPVNDFSGGRARSCWREHTPYAQWGVGIKEHALHVFMVYRGGGAPSWSSRVLVSSRVVVKFCSGYNSLEPLDGVPAILLSISSLRRDFI